MAYLSVYTDVQGPLATYSIDCIHLDLVYLSSLGSVCWTESIKNQTWLILTGGPRESQGEHSLILGSKRQIFRIQREKATFQELSRWRVLRVCVTLPTPSSMGLLAFLIAWGHTASKWHFKVQSPGSLTGSTDFCSCWQARRCPVAFLPHGPSWDHQYLMPCVVT
jgi:hypothetical protein